MSTRFMSWLAFAGWIVIPFLAGLAANAFGDRRASYFADAGLLLMAGVFSAGILGLIPRRRRSSRTWGTWTVFRNPGS